MFTTFLSLSLFFALIRTAFAQSTSFTIGTPTLTQCQGAQITWTDTNNGPYDILVVPADDVCGDAIEDLGSQNSTSMTWLVNIPAGTEVVLSIQDAACDEAWSGNITVGSSSDTSCLASPTPTPSSSPSSTPTPPPTLSPSGNPSTPPSASSPAPSTFAPAGAANAGLNPTSGAPLTHPLSTVALFGSAMLAVVAFAL